MKKIELPPGVHRLDTIREPSYILPVDYPANRWRVLLVGLENRSTGGNAVNAYAPLRIEGCQICHGTTDFGAEIAEGVGNGVNAHDECARLELADCWIHHNCGNGVLTRTKTQLRVNHCVIERNGTHCQFDHNLYLNGEYEITESLILNATNTPVHACGNYETDSHHCVQGTIFRCVVHGSERNRTIRGSHPGACKIFQCTILGNAPQERNKANDDWQVISLHRSNLHFPRPKDDLDALFLAYPQYHLYQPAKPLQSPRLGAYDYYEELHNREQAEKFWRSGCMDGWGEGAFQSQHTVPFPIFPGDPWIRA